MSAVKTGISQALQVPSTAMTITDLELSGDGADSAERRRQLSSSSATIAVTYEIVFNSAAAAETMYQLLNDPETKAAFESAVKSQVNEAIAADPALAGSFEVNSVQSLEVALFDHTGADLNSSSAAWAGVRVSSPRGLAVFFSPVVALGLFLAVLLPGWASPMRDS
jgi:hypothetical protein